MIKRDFSISFIRLIAIILIFFCHICQYFDNGLSWWLNVGVQVFLLISGYLYSNYSISSVFRFYKKNFMKILIPVYLYLLVVLITFFFTNVYLNINLLAKTLIFKQTLTGLGHFWFIPVILICYLYFPFLKSFLDDIDKDKDLIYLIKIFILMVLNEIIFHFYLNMFNAAWINCFILGMLIKRLESKDNLKKATFSLLFILGILFNIVKIILKYKSNILIDGLYLNIFEKFCNYSHILLAFIIFITFRFMYTKINCDINNKFLELSDKYIYYIYISHHIFILGNFSIFKYINNDFFAILVIIILTIISATILRYISNKLLIMYAKKEKIIK